MKKYKFIKIIDTYAIEDATSIGDYINTCCDILIAVPEEKYEDLRKKIKEILSSEIDEKFSEISLTLPKYDAFEITFSDEIEW